MNGHRVKEQRRRVAGASSGRRPTHHLTAAGLMTGALVPLAATAAFALPEGGTITTGSAAISTPTATSMRVDQTTDRAILDWTRFNIAANESVHFQQPSAASIALNRVSGQEPSAIFGSLSANGQIFLLNPSGILFGPSSRVDVGALTASTLTMSNQDFLNSQYRFTQDPSAGNAAVVNQGLITAGPGGYVALLGAAARNEGVIQAQLGSIALAAGKAATLDMRGDGLIQFVITDAVSDSVTGPDGTPLASLVSNTGTLQADGGMVTLHAKAAAGLVRSVVNQEGVVRATSLVNHGGVIKLVAGDDVANTGTIGWQANLGKVNNGTGAVTNYGMLDVSAGEVGAAQGQVTLAGEYVGHAGAILAHGSDGATGGRVLLTSSKATAVTKTGSINTSGSGSSSAGNVVVWSDTNTIYQGNITARAGAIGGDGGHAEVSGYDQLNFRGMVDLGAPDGRTGTLLLDPTTITITGGSGDGAADGTAIFQGAATAGTISFADVSPTTVYESEIEGLNADIVLQATQTITTSGTFGSAQVLLQNNRNLTLQTRNQAGDGTGGIDLTGSVDGTGLEFKTQGAGAITITGSTDGGAAGNVTLGKLTTQGGALAVTSNNGTITLRNNLSTNADAAISAGPVTLTGAIALGANVSIDSDAATTDAHITLIGTTNADLASNNRTLTLAAGTGNVSLSGAVGGTQALQTFTISSASSASLPAITTRDGGISVTATNIILNGDLSTNGTSMGGAVSLTGAVTLGANVTLRADGANPTLNTITSTIGVGGNSWSSAITPDGAILYVANDVLGSVKAIDTATQVVLATIAVGVDPKGVIITPDGSRAYVTNGGSDTVSVINVATNTVVATISLGAGTVPKVPVVSPDGTRLYVPNSGTNTVSVINTATNAVVGTIAVGTTPYAMAISPDGAKAYVANSGTTTLSIVDTASSTVTGTVTVGSSPVAVSFTPDGRKLYVANQSSSTVSVLDTATNTVTATIAGQSTAKSVMITPDGSRVYVGRVGSRIGVLSTVTDTQITQIVTAANARPMSGAISPDGKKVYFGTTNTIFAVLVVDGNLGAAGANITLTGTTDADSAGNNRTLTLASSGGTVNLTGALGGSQALQTFSVIRSGMVTLPTVTTQAGGIMVTASAITLNGDLSTNAAVIAGNVNLVGPVSLGITATMNTDATTDGNILVSNTLDADAAGNNRSLTLTAGSGTVLMSGATGGTQALNTLTVSSAANAYLPAMTIRSGGLTVTATNITLNGNVSTDSIAIAGVVGLTGAVTLGNTVTIDTDAATTDANITYSNTINGGQALTLTAGTGDVQVGGIAGGTTPLFSLTASGSMINLQAVTVAGAGTITLTSGGTGGTDDLTLTGALTSGSGAITLTAGAGVILGADVSTTGNVLITAGTAITRSAGTVSGTGVLLDAATGIGSVGAPITTAATTLAARTTGTGGILVSDAGTLIIGTVGGVSGLSTLSGAITLTAAGDMSVTQAISAGGSSAITLTASGGSLTGTADVSTGGDLTISGASVGSTATPFMLGTIGGTLNGTVNGGGVTDSYNVKALALTTLNLGMITAVGPMVGVPVTIDATGGSILHGDPGTDITGGRVNFWGASIGALNFDLEVITDNPPVMCNGVACDLPYFVNAASARYNDLLLANALSQSGRYLLAATPEEGTLLTAGVLPEYIYRCLDQDRQAVVCTAGAVWHDDDGTSSAMETEPGQSHEPTDTVANAAVPAISPARPGSAKTEPSPVAPASRR